MSETPDFYNFRSDRPGIGALMEQRRKDKEFIDVQLKLRDKLYDAHRVILSLYSPVLQALISDQWSTTKICPLSDEYVDAEIMEDLLSYLYTGSIKLTWDNVQPLCVAAHYLQISALLEAGVHFLTQLITVENVLTLFEFSVGSQIDGLRDSCVFFVITNKSVFESSEILEFSAESFKDLLIALAEQYCEPEVRMDTFQCIVRWTEKDSPKRLDELPVLLKNIPLEELPNDYLTETVSAHELVKDSTGSIEAVSAALANYETYSKSSTKAKDNLVIIGGDSNTRYQSALKVYDWFTGKWRKVTNLPIPRQMFIAGMVNEKDIVVCGGRININNRRYSGMEETDTMIMFEWATQTWKDLPKIPVVQENFGMAILNGRLYFAGGILEDRSDNSATLFCYCFETQQWTQLKDMIEPRHNLQLVACKDCLYAIGGSRTNTVERYDPARDEWTMVAKVRGAYGNIDWGFSAIAHRDKIYACFETGVEEYDPELDAWSSLPDPVFGPKTCLASLNGKLLTVSGQPFMNKEKLAEGIYEFDFWNRKWVKLCKLGIDLTMHWALAGSFHCVETCQRIPSTVSFGDPSEYLRSRRY